MPINFRRMRRKWRTLWGFDQRLDAGADLASLIIKAVIFFFIFAVLWFLANRGGKK